MGDKLICEVSSSFSILNKAYAESISASVLLPAARTQMEIESFPAEAEGLSRVHTN